jgi:hypothetical protein
MSHDYWLQLVRRWLRNGGHSNVDGWALGAYTRHYISRDGLLMRETVEILDPENFAREHISADVISIRPISEPDNGAPPPFRH